MNHPNSCKSRFSAYVRDQSPSNMTTWQDQQAHLKNLGETMKERLKQIRMKKLDQIDIDNMKMFHRIYKCKPNVSS